MNNEAVEARSHRNILAASEEDLRRQRERAHQPLPPVPWRFHAGGWQRWSELDRDFAPHEPPASLVAHAEAAGGAVEDQVLELVEGHWAPVGEQQVTVDEAPTEQPDVADAPDASAAFEAQIEAWRRRR